MLHLTDSWVAVRVRHDTRIVRMANLTFVCAVNQEEVFKRNLLISPDLAEGAELHVIRGASSAARAYNEGWRRVNGDVVCFIHQDVYLPSGWVQDVLDTLETLASIDKDWGVVGVYGVDIGGERHGWIYSSGLRRVLGRAFEVPQRVRTLDEVVIITRRGTNLWFDEALRGFHLYGTDICLQAEEHGRRNYVVPAFCIHNSNGIRQLPWSFWQACWYIRRKWAHRLPVQTPCVRVDLSAGQLIGRMISDQVHGLRKRRGVGIRAEDPREVYEAIRRDGDQSRATGCCGRR